MGLLLTSLIIQLSSFYKLKKFNKFLEAKSKKKSKFYIQHTLKFVTLYYPGSIKNLRLLLRSQAGKNGLLDNSDKKKILVKQSYVILIWINYLSTKSLEVDNSLPGFFIHPTKNYKTTITKAPMAHKTFSQEQYMVRYYSLSISFYTPALDLSDTYQSLSKLAPLPTINYSLYFLLFVIKSIPCISTNLLLLKRYTILIYSTDKTYFSFYEFNS